MLTCSRRCRFSGILFAVLFSALVPAHMVALQATDTTSALQRARLAVQGLQSWYNQQNGLYDTGGWWHSANAITTLADYEKTASTKEFDTVFKNTFEVAQKTKAGFLNMFYDDEGWWALAWIDA
jgi:hypothetical protein